LLIAGSYDEVKEIENLMAAGKPTIAQLESELNERDEYIGYLEEKLESIKEKFDDWDDDEDDDDDGD
jgi:DNA gyrase/topoisomerase IV subunit A